MRLKELEGDFTFCQLTLVPDDLHATMGESFYMLSAAPDEISLFCPTALTPKDTLKAEEGWMALKIDAVLEFSLVGILAKISGTLAEAGVSILAMSTYNTDYIGIKRDKRAMAFAALRKAGYTIAA